MIWGENEVILVNISSLRQTMKNGKTSTEERRAILKSDIRLKKSNIGLKRESASENQDGHLGTCIRRN